VESTVSVFGFSLGTSKGDLFQTFDIRLSPSCAGVVYICCAGHGLHFIHYD
jgi:hypothetical protein